MFRLRFVHSFLLENINLNYLKHVDEIFFCLLCYMLNFLFYSFIFHNAYSCQKTAFEAVSYDAGVWVHSLLPFLEGPTNLYRHTCRSRAILYKQLMPEAGEQSSSMLVSANLHGITGYFLLRFLTLQESNQNRSRPHLFKWTGTRLWSRH